MYGERADDFFQREAVKSLQNKRWFIMSLRGITVMERMVEGTPCIRD